MTLGMKSDGATVAPFAMDAQRDLLRHRAARHEDRVFFAQQFSDVALEGLEQLAAAVAVGKFMLPGRLGDFEQLLAQRLRRVAEKPRARPLDPLAPLVGYREVLRRFCVRTLPLTRLAAAERRRIGTTLLARLPSPSSTGVMTRLPSAW